MLIIVKLHHPILIFGIAFLLLRIVLFVFLYTLYYIEIFSIRDIPPFRVGTVMVNTYWNFDGDFFDGNFGDRVFTVRNTRVSGVAGGNFKLVNIQSSHHHRRFVYS